MAQSAPQAPAPNYRVYQSHVEWLNGGDCVTAPATASEGPAYRVYQSHVEWRADPIAVDQAAGAAASTEQTWTAYPSHVERSNHSNGCSVHPIIMSAPRASYN